MKIAGVNRTRKQLADGKWVTYHYAWRGKGAPCFWEEPKDGKPGSRGYIEALQDARKFEPPASAKQRIPKLVDMFLDSGEYRKLASRTQADYRKWALRFASEFKTAPMMILEDRRFRHDVAEWRDKWAHSPKQAQYAWTVAKRVASWGVDRGLLGSHVISGGTSIYSADRAEIIWADADVKAILAVSPPYVQRIVISAVQTGLRPGDLVRLSRSHIQVIDGERVVQIRTNKRKRMATLPVLPEFARVLDETPSDRLYLLSKADGAPLSERRASNVVRDYRRKAKLRENLRLYDFRGTCVTRHLRAGVPLQKLAGIFGWSLRYAQQVIDDYAAIDPAGAVEVLSMLEKNGNGT